MSAYLPTAQYRELAAFAHLRPTSMKTRKRLDRGARVIIAQNRSAALVRRNMAATLFAVNKGFLTTWMSKVLAFESGLHRFRKTSYAALERIEKNRAFDKEGKDEAELTQAITAFKKTFA